jgi:hypothetical protein
MQSIVFRGWQRSNLGPTLIVSVATLAVGTWYIRELINTFARLLLSAAQTLSTHGTLVDVAGGQSLESLNQTLIATQTVIGGVQIAVASDAALVMDGLDLFTSSLLASATIFCLCAISFCFCGYLLSVMNVTSRPRARQSQACRSRVKWHPRPFFRRIRHIRKVSDKKVRPSLRSTSTHSMSALSVYDRVNPAPYIDCCIRSIVQIACVVLAFLCKKWLPFTWAPDTRIFASVAPVQAETVRQSTAIEESGNWVV